MVFKHPHTYGLMAMMELKGYNYFMPFRNQLEKYTKFFMETHFFDDVAPQHLSVLYFSYPEKYSSEYIKKLETKIKEILKQHLPIQLRVQGLQGWWEHNLGVPAICLNIVDYGPIYSLRKALIDELKKDIEHFNDSELDFTPHIGVAIVDTDFKKEIKLIVDASKKTKEVTLELNHFYIYYPKGPEKIPL